MTGMCLLNINVLSYKRSDDSLRVLAIGSCIATRPTKLVSMMRKLWSMRAMAKLLRVKSRQPYKTSARRSKRRDDVRNVKRRKNLKRRRRARRVERRRKRRKRSLHQKMVRLYYILLLQTSTAHILHYLIVDSIRLAALAHATDDGSKGLPAGPVNKYMTQNRPLRPKDITPVSGL